MEVFALNDEYDYIVAVLIIGISNITDLDNTKAAAYQFL
jgi:hypothetical protein